MFKRRKLMIPKYIKAEETLLNLIKKKKTPTPLALDRHNRITVVPRWLWHNFFNFKNAKFFFNYYFVKKYFL
jgi:hypothetical protein